MDEALPVLIVIALVSLGGLAIYLSWLAEKKRREALQALADELGFQFYPGRDTEHDEEYDHFEVFRRGHSRAAYNTLIGDLEIGGRVFGTKLGDFKYTVTSGSGKNRSSTTYNFSYLIVHLPWYVPDLLIRPEGMFDKLAGVFGFDDIDFESAEFSRKFFVKSPDKKFAYDVITPHMMEYLLEALGLTVDIEFSRCCLTDGSSRWEPRQFMGAIGFLEHFFELWPEHVTSSLDQGDR